MSNNTTAQDLGQYNLLETVAKSDFATVYRAVDTNLGREVALKVLDPVLMQDTDWVRRFRQDFQAVVRLQHPHIVTIYDVDEVAGKLYIAMQLAHGGSFARAMAKQGQVPWQKVLTLLEPVCEALDYAHGQSVVHGDLKPTNILVDPKAGPLLTDFGFVRLLKDNAMSAGVGNGVLGSPAYIAPEAWEASAAEAPADIYALGCIVYEMLMAEALFKGNNAVEIMKAHAEGPAMPTPWPDDVPEDIAAILHKALAWDPQARYRSAMSFWNALNALDIQASGQSAKLKALAQKWRAETESALKDGKWRVAKMAVSSWLAVAPHDTAALDAQKTIDQKLASMQQQPVQVPVPTPPCFKFSTLPDQQMGSLVDAMTPEQFLDSQGQKQTYKAILNGQKVTLRWCFPPDDIPERRIMLEQLIHKGAPSDAYLWPTHIVESQDAPGFGYLMPMLPQSVKAVSMSPDKLLQRGRKWSQNTQPTMRMLTTMALALADSFLALHLQGLCYQTISDEHFFFDPNTEKLYIKGAENVVMASQAAIGMPDILRFAAPELIREEVPPNVQTDLYSLAALLFVIFMGHHPLEGEKTTVIPTLDATAKQRLYGTDPVFIFDPADASNRPVPGYHVTVLNNWPIYPQFMRDLFICAFTDGIKDPHSGRVRVSEWRGALTRLRDSIFYCSQCGAENFYDLDALKASGGQTGVCWSCGNALQLPPRLRIEDDVLAPATIIMLNHNTRLFPHHIDSERRYDFSVPLAEVNQHPNNPNIWGLKNLGAEKWVITTSDGAVKDVDPGRNVTLAQGTRINFGKVEGEIAI